MSKTPDREGRSDRIEYRSTEAVVLGLLQPKAEDHLPSLTARDPAQDASPSAALSGSILKMTVSR